MKTDIVEALDHFQKKKIKIKKPRDHIQGRALCDSCGAEVKLRFSVKNFSGV